MPENIEQISFRNLNDKFVLVTDLDKRTRTIIMHAGFHIRPDDNAMLLMGYIDRTEGLSFELLCAACVFEDEEVALEPGNKTVSQKFRYGSFQGSLIPFDDPDRLFQFKEKIQMIREGYQASPDVAAVRSLEELDSSRAPGYPDDIMVYFVKEGYRSEGIWCRTVKIDLEQHLIKMRMLNEPFGPFGKHEGDIVDVTFVPMENGEVKAAAVL